MRIIQTVEGNLVWQNYDIPTNDEILNYIEDLEDDLAEITSIKDGLVNKNMDDINKVAESMISKSTKATIRTHLNKIKDLTNDLELANLELARLRNERVTDSAPIIIFL